MNQRYLQIVHNISKHKQIASLEVLWDTKGEVEVIMIGNK